MAAKPRVTVRLAPSVLHGLAFVAARDGQAPAEVARLMLSAQVQATISRRGWFAEHEASYRAWLAEQAARGVRPESPTQADYDALALGLPAPPAAPAPAPSPALARPLSAIVGESDALARRLARRLADGKARS